MAWYNKFWPFNKEARERQRQIEKAFDAQLEEAQQRHGDLDDIVRQLRENREEGRTSVPPKPALQGSDT